MPSAIITSRTKAALYNAEAERDRVQAELKALPVADNEI